MSVLKSLSSATSPMTWVVSAVLLLIALFLAVPAVPHLKSWYGLVVVRSQSMEPWLPLGSLAFFKPQPRYELGDSVVFASDLVSDQSVLIQHVRGIERKNGDIWYLTQDNRAEKARSLRVAAQEVQGRVVWSLPYIGFVTFWLRTPVGLACLILVPAFFLALREMRTW